MQTTSITKRVTMPSKNCLIRGIKTVNQYAGSRWGNCFSSNLVDILRYPAIKGSFRTWIVLNKRHVRLQTSQICADVKPLQFLTCDTNLEALAFEGRQMRHWPQVRSRCFSGNAWETNSSALHVCSFHLGSTVASGTLAQHASTAILTRSKRASRMNCDLL